MKRDEALDKIEELAFNAVLRLEQDMERCPEVPVSPQFIRMLKDAHGLIMAGMKNSPLGEDMEPEELLIRLEEIKGRLQKKVLQKRVLNESNVVDMAERRTRPLGSK